MTKNHHGSKEREIEHLADFARAHKVLRRLTALPGAEVQARAGARAFRVRRQQRRDSEAAAWVERAARELV